MTDEKAAESETSRLLTENYQTNIEHLLLGGDSMQGVARAIVFVALYVLVFGTLFHFVMG